MFCGRCRLTIRRARQAAAAQERTISRLQVRLMRAQAPAERRQLLDQLWEAEQRSRAAEVRDRASALLVGGQRASARRSSKLSRTNELVLEYVLSEPRVLLPGDRSESESESAEAAVQGARSRPVVDRFTQDLRSEQRRRRRAARRALRGRCSTPIPEWRTAQPAVHRSRRAAASAAVRRAPESA